MSTTLTTDRCTGLPETVACAASLSGRRILLRRLSLIAMLGSDGQLHLLRIRKRR